jgi:hypothetical protein
MVPMGNGKGLFRVRSQQWPAKMTFKQCSAARGY